MLPWHCQRYESIASEQIPKDTFVWGCYISDGSQLDQVNSRDFGGAVSMYLRVNKQLLKL